MAYTKILRRIRDKKTNYNRRKKMLMGHTDFVTVQISNENTQVQIHKPELTGDKVISSAHSRFLIKKGWKGSRKNIPASYLTGYSAGKVFSSAGILSPASLTPFSAAAIREVYCLVPLYKIAELVPFSNAFFPAK